MNIKQIHFLLAGIFFSIFLISCNKDNNTIEYTDATNDAQIYSFSLVAPFVKKGDSTSRAQDSIRILKVNATNYNIDQIANIVYNQDSLPYLTTLNNVKVTTSFNTTYGVAKVQVENRDTIYDWNTTDSIDFSKTPIKMRVHSWGGTMKIYDINIRIHKVDPNDILWTQMSSFTATGKSKTMLAKDGTFYAFILNENKVILNTKTTNNQSWTEQSISGLPSNMNIESFTLTNELFNAVDKSGLSYTSSDGINWTKQANGFNVINIIGTIPSLSTSDEDTLLAIAFVSKDAANYFVKGTSLNNLQIVEKIEGLVSNKVPTNFPISSISSFSNDVNTKTDRMLVVAGGISDNGITSSNRWLIKSNSSGNLEMTSFIQTPPFDKNAGLSIFPYNNLFYILTSKKLFSSSNKGETWSSTTSPLDARINTQSGQTVIVDSNNYIWILGGESSSNIYLNEVWKGKLNSLN